METEPAKSVADLVDEAAEAVDADADEGWEGVGPEAEREGDNEWEAVLKEVVDTSVSAAVKSEVTNLVEDNSGALLIALGQRFLQSQNFATAKDNFDDGILSLHILDQPGN